MSNVLLEARNRNSRSYPIRAKSHHKTIYFEVINTVANIIEKQFGQKDYQIYSDGQQLDINLQTHANSKNWN